MYREIFTSFFFNMKVLKTFILEVESGIASTDLEKTAKEEPAAIMLLALTSHRIDPARSLLDPDLAKEVEEAIGQDIEVEKGNGDSVTIRVKSKRLASMWKNSLDRIRLSAGHWNILLQSALINGIAFLELAVSRLLTHHLTNHPESARIGDKQLRLDEIRSLGSLEEAEKYLIDQEVERLMFGGLATWLDYFKKQIKLTLNEYGKFHDHLVELFQRRHLVVHNGGIVNSLYLRKVHPRFTEELAVGDRLQIDRDYIDRAITVLEVAGAYFILEMWKKAEKVSRERIDVVQEEAYSQMLDENWDLAETLYGFLKDEKDLQADEELMFTVNHWQCMKWNNKYEDISAEIEGADFSAYCLRFQVALAALRSDKESFFQLLDQAVPHEIPIDAALEWPLFREMRGFPEFDAFAAKHGIGPEAEEEEDHESQEAQFDRVSLA